MKGLEVEFGDPDIRQRQYISVLDEREALWGFAQLFPMHEVTRIGLGMRPDWCGRGMGKRFMQTIVREARRRRPADEIDLEVMTWNERAIRAYQRAGFHITDTYERLTPTGNALFHCMVYEPRQMRNSNLCLYEKAQFCVLFMKARGIVAFVTTGYAVYGCWFIMETSAKVQYT